jgi:hypothetical protein
MCFFLQLKHELLETKTAHVTSFVMLVSSVLLLVQLLWKKEEENNSQNGSFFNALEMRRGVAHN